MSEFQRDESFMKKYGVADWGGFNQPPTPYEECDVSEMGGFWSMLNSYGFPNSENTEFRQVHLKDKPYIQSVHIFIYFDKIFMIKVDRIQTGPNEWKDVPTCYRVGCRHEYADKILNSRTGDCESTCKKCGFTYRYNCGD